MLFINFSALILSGSQVKASPRFSNEKRRKSKVDEARDILAHVVVCHVAAPKYNFQNKLAYIAVMLRRMLQAVVDPSMVDDRDYYGNKRLELAGKGAKRADKCEGNRMIEGQYCNYTSCSRVLMTIYIILSAFGLSCRRPHVAPL